MIPALRKLVELLGAVALKLAQDDHKGKETDLRKDKRTLKVEIKEQELSNEDVVKSLLRVCKKKEPSPNYFQKQSF